MMLDHPASSAVARTPMTATRAQSIVIISRRRSTRSTSTPPGRANSSQGSQAAPLVAETISGFLVCAATKSGAAMVARPLPRAEVVLAVHSFANRAPRGSATSSDATGIRAAVRPPSIATAISPDRVSRGHAGPLAGLPGLVRRRAGDGYLRALTREMSLRVSEDCDGRGDGTFSGVVLIM